MWNGGPLPGKVFGLSGAFLWAGESESQTPRSCVAATSFVDSPRALTWCALQVLRIDTTARSSRPDF
jgi:hypothetical protein